MRGGRCCKGRLFSYDCNKGQGWGLGLCFIYSDGQGWGLGLFYSHDWFKYLGCFNHWWMHVFDMSGQVDHGFSTLGALVLFNEDGGARHLL